MTARRPDPDHPTTLSGPAAELYAKYASGERVAPGAAFTLVTPDGHLTGPPAAWMLNPQLGLALERLGYGVRFELTLPPRWREIVILLVAAAEDSPFERYAHHPAGRRAGLSEEEIRRIDAGEFTGRDSAERAAVRCATAILTDGDLSDELWEEAERTLGRQRIFDVVTLIGWYRLVALQLRVFDIQPPERTEVEA